MGVLYRPSKVPNLRCGVRYLQWKKNYTNGTAIRKNVVFLHNKFRISAQKIFDFGTITIVSDLQAQCKWKVYIDLFALTGQTECAVSLSHFVCVCFLQFHVIIIPLHIVQAGSGQAFVSFVSKKRCTKYTAINNVYMCTNALCSVLGARSRGETERERMQGWGVWCVHVLMGRVVIHIMLSSEFAIAFHFHCARPTNMRLR